MSVGVMYNIPQTIPFKWYIFVVFGSTVIILEKYGIPGQSRSQGLSSFRKERVGVKGLNRLA